MVSLAAMVWMPSASAVGLNDQFPSAVAVAVERREMPSTLKRIRAFPSAVPFKAMLEETPSLADRPVSASSSAVTTGATAVPPVDPPQALRGGIAGVAGG